jgi:hypothetical protein
MSVDGWQRIALSSGGPAHAQFTGVGEEWPGGVTPAGPFASAWETGGLTGRVARRNRPN